MELHINGANIFKKKILLLEPYYKTLLMHTLYFLDKVYKLTIFYIYMHAVEQILLPTVPCKPGLIPHSRKLFANE